MKTGFTYVLGGPLRVRKDVEEFSFTSSYRAPKHRAYLGMDVVNDTERNVHDEHIGNGTTNARDLLFSSGAEKVDPPSITVLNCAPTPKESFVYYHTHPYGAVYLPYSCRICFWTDTKLCVALDEARWVSPNLFYYETFEKIEEEN
jgi:hypothetical protein